MPTNHTFIQVRLPARNLALGRATRRRGAHIQALVEPVVRRAEGPAFRVWAQVEGLEPAGLKELTEEIEDRYGVLPRLSPARSGHHVAYDVFPRQLQDAFWGTLLAFQTSFGPPWLRFEGEEVAFRAQGVDCEPPDCAARLERALALAQSSAPVEIVQVPDADLQGVRDLSALRESALADQWEPPAAIQPSAAPPRQEARPPPRQQP